MFRVQQHARFCCKPQTGTFCSLTQALGYLDAGRLFNGMAKQLSNSDRAFRFHANRRLCG
jgi:hypothetical protein